jgi:hypothetical protein
MSRTPSFITTEPYETRRDGGLLPTGSFVKPIKVEYLPKSFEDRDAFCSLKYFNPESEIYVFSHYGIHTIPKRIVREIS